MHPARWVAFVFCSGVFIMAKSGYELSRIWFDWCFENPEKISPNHTALYFFCIEHCNRLGWKEKFGLPTTMAKEAIGIKSYNTYINTLNDLVDFGFVIMIEKSKNQYSSNIVALSNFNKALNKALDKALIKHVTKQCESTGESISSIDKQLTINKEQITEPFNIWVNDFNFLKSDSVWFEQQIQMKYKIQPKDLDHRLQQYWLSLQKSNFTGNLNQIRAGLIKWLNTWNEKEATSKPQEQKRTVKILS